MVSEASGERACVTSLGQRCYQSNKSLSISGHTSSFLCLYVCIYMYIYIYIYMSLSLLSPSLPLSLSLSNYIHMRVLRSSHTDRVWAQSQRGEARQGNEEKGIGDSIQSDVVPTPCVLQLLLSLLPEFYCSYLSLLLEFYYSCAFNILCLNVCVYIHLHLSLPLSLCLSLSLSLSLSHYTYNPYSRNWQSSESVPSIR